MAWCSASQPTRSLRSFAVLCAECVIDRALNTLALCSMELADPFRKESSWPSYARIRDARPWPPQ